MQDDYAKTLHCHTAPFPPLLLSENDKRALRQSTYDFLELGVKEFERYARTKKLPEQHTWTLLRERDDMHLYQRETTTEIQGGVTPLVGIGTVPGPFSDCIYGATAPTTNDVRVKNAYMQEQIFSFATLATLEEPTADSPFQCMTISWLVKMLPYPARIFVKHRDVICISATGTTTDSEGDIIAYHLAHSVDLPECTPLKEYQRVDVSMLTLWRALSPNRAQIYLRTFTNLKQNKMAKVALRSFAESMLLSRFFAEVGQHKKLTWLLRHPPANTSPKLSAFPAGSKNCATCGKSVESRFGRRSSSSRRLLWCALCKLPVCNTCEVKKTVHAVTSDNVLGNYSVRLCPTCWSKAVTADASEIASEEVLDRLDPDPEGHDSLQRMLLQSEARSCATEGSESVQSKTWST